MWVGGRCPEVSGVCGGSFRLWSSEAGPGGVVMPHCQLSQHQPDGVETVLVKPGRCAAELTDMLVVLGMALGSRARLAAGFHPQGRVSGRSRQSPPELGELRRWRFRIWPLCPLPLDTVIKIHLNCHFVLSCSVVSDSCDPTDCSPPGSTVHGILQVRILEMIAISFSGGSSQPRDPSPVFAALQEDSSPAEPPVKPSLTE
ncbi:unnamed protein product [Rangifer tarandus platyrhynchus]|uniref:Uncharacterized protein n=2 Tax=Rangifer tarandus platyrhynchus TaxID=3082113 RepID=A0ABN8ZZ63_RANTA|nr:unnamed protein product [Rangifer tarandus platyrhynchus]